MKIKQKKYKGFTLVELIVVIAIFGILATVSVFGYLGFIEKARLSNDEQLVSQINNLIKAEDTYSIGIGSSNDYLQIEYVLKKQGIENVTTQSKNNYIFFDNENRKAVLASLDGEGINIVFGDNLASSKSSTINTHVVNAKYNFNSTSVKTSASNNTSVEKGKYLKHISSPESFIQGYTLITAASRDGLAQDIHNIRNGGGAQANANDAKISILNSIKDAKNINLTAGELLENMSKYTVFINGEIGTEDQQVILDGTDWNDIVVMLFGSNISTINSSCFDKAEEYNLSIIDLPASVESISEEAIETLNSSGLLDSCSITYANDDLIDNLKNKSDSASDENKENYDNLINSLAKAQNRNDELKTVTINYYNEIGGSKSGNAYLSKDVVVAKNTKRIKTAHELDINSLKNSSDSQMNSFEGYFINDSEISGASGEIPLNEEAPNSIDVYAKWTSDSSTKFSVFGYKTESEYSSINSSYSASVILGLVNSKQINSFFNDKFNKEYTNYVIYPNSDYTVDEDLNISSGITFWVPYTTSFTNVSKFFEKAGGENEVFYGCLTNSSGSPIIKSGDDVDGKTAKVTVNFNSKVTNSGNIIVGAEVFATTTESYQRYSGSITEQFGALNISDDAYLYNQSGNIYVHGFLKNNGENNFISYSGNIYEGMLIEDWPGGSIGYLAMFKYDVSPFNQWELLYLQGNVKIGKSTNYIAIFTLYVYGTFYSSNISVVGDENSLFYFDDFESYIVKNYNESNLELNIFGAINDGSVKMTLNFTYSNKTLCEEIDFSKIPFPVYNMNITIKTNSTLTLSKNVYKFLPGSEINVEENSSFNIDTSFALYESFIRIDKNKYKEFDDKNGLFKFPSDFKKATINNKGNISLNISNKYMEFGGDIEMTEKSTLNIKESSNLLMYNDTHTGKSVAKSGKYFKEFTGSPGTGFFASIPTSNATYLLTSICTDSADLNDSSITTMSYNGKNYYYDKNYTKINGIVYKTTDELKNVSGVTVIN